NLTDYPSIEVKHPEKDVFDNSKSFYPYTRDENLARPWAIPGTEGLEHRTGGLEKEDLTGNVSYDSLNHEKMVNLRAKKIQRIVDDIPLQKVHGPKEGEILVLNWGSTYGAAHTAANNLRKQGYSVADANLRYINPFPKNLEEVLRSYKKILIPEMNTGQLQFLIQAKFTIETVRLSKVQGKPFNVNEIQNKVINLINR
ncbi:MAG: transketolase C-terminal domain-containing protein, partial [Candidatus Hodarchaeota archaeon]